MYDIRFCETCLSTDRKAKLLNEPTSSIPTATISMQVCDHVEEIPAMAAGTGNLN